MAGSKLDVGIDLSKRILDNQLSSLDQLHSKVGVLLGFDATVMGVIFSFGRTWVTSHVVVAGIAAAPLFLAAVIFGFALRNEDYLEVPDPNKLAAKINNPAVTIPLLQDWAIGNLLGAFLANQKLIVKKFSLVNSAIVLMLIGLGVFVIGAFFP